MFYCQSTSEPVGNETVGVDPEVWTVVSAILAAGSACVMWLCGVGVVASGPCIISLRGENVNRYDMGLVRTYQSTEISSLITTRTV